MICGKTIIFACLVALALPTVADAAATPLLQEIRVTKNKITIIPHSSFKDPYLRKSEFFVEYYDPDLNLEELDDSIAAIPFILCAIPAIWFSGKTYTIETMDEDLFYSLEIINHVFKLFYPKYKWHGKLVPHKLIKNTPPLARSEDEVAILFSGGLDSTCTSFAHLDKKQLLLTIRGCDVQLGKVEKWHTVVKQVTEFAQTYGHETLFLSFNFYGMLNRPYFSRAMGNWWAKTSGSLSHAGLVAPVLYLKGYKHLLFASSNTVECPRPFGNHPLIDNNLRFADIAVAHDGGELTRPEKVRLISTQAKKMRVPLPQLRVCRRDRDGRNCGHCFGKCLLTINNILSEGLDYTLFGFDVPLETVINQTKNCFMTRTKFLKCGDLWDWGCSQKSTQKRRKQIKKASEPLRSYLEWFLHLNLDQYCRENRRLYEKKKPFYAQLWQLAYQPAKRSVMGIKQPIW